MMKKLLFFTAILILLHHGSHAQKKEQELIDSLFNVLKTEKGNITEVRTLNALAFRFRNIDPDTSIYFADAAMALATKLRDESGIANSYSNRAAANLHLAQFEESLQNSSKAISIYNQLLLSEKSERRAEVLDQKGNAYSDLASAHYSVGNLAEAMKGFSAALKIFEETGNNPAIANTYSNIGIIYAEEGNYPEALTAELEALRIRETMNDQEGIGASYSNIGNAYDGMNNFREALKNHMASLKIREELKDKKGIADSYNNIGNAYEGMEDFPEALKNYFAALKIEEETGDRMGISISHTNIGFVYSRQKKYPDALKSYFTSLKISAEIADKENMANVFTALGSIYTKQQKYGEALKYLDKGLQLSKEIGSLEHIYNAYDCLTLLDSAMGNYQEAFEHHKLYIAYRDSLFNEENTTKLLQVQMQYDFDKKEAAVKAEQDKKDALTNAEITRQKIVRNFSLAGVFGILALSAYVIYNFRKREKLEVLQELAHERLRISRELHDDIGSTLGSIAVYSDVAKNRSLKNDNSVEILSKIGAASRELIEKMSDIVWSLNPDNETFEQLQNRMQAFAAMILTARNISFDFKSDDKLDTLVLSSEQRKNVFLIYKEAIHNIAKYAACATVIISISKSGNDLLLSIRDDGKGFDARAFEEGHGDAYNGSGLKNMKARAAEMKAFISIVSRVNEGTAVELKIKV